MIEKTVSGELLDDGKFYEGSFESGIYCHVKDENDGNTYVVCFSTDGNHDDLPFDKGQYLILYGHLRYSNTDYEELDVQRISIPFMQYFDVMEN